MFNVNLSNVQLEEYDDTNSDIKHSDCGTLSILTDESIMNIMMCSDVVTLGRFILANREIYKVFQIGISLSDEKIKLRYCKLSF